MSSEALVMHYMPFYCISIVFFYTLPSPKGNIALIPWTISVQQGNAISLKENKIVVQEDGYYLVFGQVLSHWNLSITNLILHLTFPTIN